MKPGLEERTLESLEWDRLKSYLQEQAHSKKAKELCLSLAPAVETNIISVLLEQTSQALQLLEEGLDFSFELPDIEDILSRLKISAQLLASQLLDLKQVFQLSRRSKSFLKQLDSLRFSQIKLFYDNLYTCDELVLKIQQIIDDSGNIKDDASDKLKQFYVQLTTINQQIEAELFKIIKSTSLSKALQEPLFTLRNNRYVLPVLANMAYLIPGLVHDSSASGLTIYMEPLSIVELTNKRRLLSSQIEQEKERLLQELSHLAITQLPKIEKTFLTLTNLDFIYARARLAIKYGGTLPEISSNTSFQLKQARHPLLVLQQQLPVVANDITVQKSIKAIIITGPNTGGKTVFLKTAGLLCLMLRAGLLLPVAHGSSAPLFQQIYANIGDDQSLEQNLSTFSSSIGNIIEIIKKANETTLVLLDEIGTGTDPKEGIALAKVILDELYAKGAVILCTTHYNDLNALAHSNASFENASMEFNEDTLCPSYRLRLGIAGHSHALPIAAQLGLDKALIKKAEDLLSSGKTEFEYQVEDLNHRLAVLNKQEEELAYKQKELQLTKENLESSLQALENQQQRIKQELENRFQEDYRKAKKLIADITANLQKNPTLAHAKATQGDLERIRKDLGWHETTKPINKQNFQIGQTVKIQSLNTTGTIEKIIDAGEESKTPYATVITGNFKVKVPVSDLEHHQVKLSKKLPQTSKPKAASKDYSFHLAPCFVRGQENTLDLHGKRAEEALRLLEVFIDKCYLAQISPVMIIHGHGTGAIKTIVRDYLRTSPYPNKHRPGESYEGGDGVTMVEF